MTVVKAAESFACINSTSGRVVASVWVKVSIKSSCKTKAYWFYKNHVLPKKTLKSLTERLQSLLRLSGVDSIVTQSSSSQEGPTTILFYF